jgi:hypothetical protein
MKKILFFTLILSLILFLNQSVKGQGCSDAGICTLNSIKDQSIDFSSEETNRNLFKTGLTYGIGERNIKYLNPYVEYSNSLTEKLTVSGKLVYVFTEGELASTNSLSDIFIAFDYSVFNKELSTVSVLLGLKIPLSSSDILNDNIPLPMNYQASLGTYDLIIGFNYLYNKLGVSLALQQPISNSNENEFFTSVDTDLLEYNYTSTNSYERKGDIMNRISYSIPLMNNKFIIRPSVLSIYHLANDTYIDEVDQEQEIDGSQGLTVNGNLFFTYNFSDNKQVEISLGSPFVTRDARPDGLTRKIVAGIEYKYSF